MITSDELYQLTKQLVKSGAPLNPPFKKLADWISTNYGVRVLNVVYDIINPDDRPRLSVILETEEEALKFRNGEYRPINAIEEKRVREQFETILSEQRNWSFALDRMFVYFGAFEPEARSEANMSVTKAEIQHFKTKLANNDLWEISRLCDRVTFFFYTDSQVRQYEAAGLREAYAQEYARLVQAYDEFGYLQKRGLRVYFDSKQNFDTKYQSNWFYYYS